MSEMEVQRLKSSELSENQKDSPLQGGETNGGNPSAQPGAEATGSQPVKTGGIPREEQQISEGKPQSIKLVKSAEGQNRLSLRESENKIAYEFAQAGEAAVGNQKESEARYSTPDKASIIGGLTALLDSSREEVRSRRILLFSNLILSFMIPLSALAVQNTEM